MNTKDAIDTETRHLNAQSHLTEAVAHENAAADALKAAEESYRVARNDDAWQQVVSARDTFEKRRLVRSFAADVASSSPPISAKDTAALAKELDAALVRADVDRLETAVAPLIEDIAQHASALSETFRAINDLYNAQNAAVGEVEEIAFAMQKPIPSIGQRHWLARIVKAWPAIDPIFATIYSLAQYAGQPQSVRDEFAFATGQAVRPDRSVPTRSSFNVDATLEQDKAALDASIAAAKAA